MPARVILASGTWTPITDGVPNSTTVRMHAIGAGGVGGSGMANGGGGGGGGERRAADHVVADNTVLYSVSVAAGGSGDQTYIEDATPAYVVRAAPGDPASDDIGGAGGTGGTGAFIAHDGGAGGNADASIGGGGASGGFDGVAGNNGGSGATGGGAAPSGTQFNSGSKGGGGAGNTGAGAGGNGIAWGGGGGGGGPDMGTFGTGAEGAIIICWGAMLETYPDDLTEGFKLDPSGGSGNSGWLLLLGISLLMLGI